MPSHWRFRIRDILNAIEKTETFAQGLDLGEFERNDLVRAATQRYLEIVGEAVSHLPTEVTDRYPDIP